MSGPAPVLFDLDGCLVDSLASVVRCWSETLPRYELPVPPVEVLAANVGPPVTEAAAAYAPGRDAETVAEIVTDYRARSARARDVEPFPGIGELLDTLTSAGRPLGIATSKSQEVTDPLLARLGLTGRFAVIESTRPDDAPDTDKATIVARALAAFASRRPVAHVGDRHHDVVGAHANGLLAIGALWGYGGEAELVRAGADVLAARPADVAVALERL